MTFRLFRVLSLIRFVTRAMALGDDNYGEADRKLCRGKVNLRKGAQSPLGAVPPRGDIRAKEVQVWGMQGL
jgi:hypothetical protein